MAIVVPDLRLKTKVVHQQKQAGAALEVCKLYSNILVKFKQDSAGFNKERVIQPPQVQ